MAKSYIGADNVARKIKQCYIGVDGKARKIKRVYIGVNGIAKLAYVHYIIAFDANGGTGTMSAQEVDSSNATINSNTFTRTGYSFTGWNTKADGSGTAYSSGQIINFASDTTLYAQWAINYYTITYKHTNDSNWYSDDETGRQQCYELRIGGEIQPDRGVFTNNPSTESYPYGTEIEVACTYYDDGSKYTVLGQTFPSYKSASVNIYNASGGNLADNSSTHPFGYYPYGNSESLTFPNGKDSSAVAYYKFKLTHDTTIDFWAKTNAPAVYNKEAYWDCYITTS